MYKICQTNYVSDDNMSVYLNNNPQPLIAAADKGVYTWKSKLPAHWMVVTWH